MSPLSSGVLRVYIYIYSPDSAGSGSNLYLTQGSDIEELTHPNNAPTEH